MLMLPPSVHVYVAAQPTDLRKSFNGLSTLVTPQFGQDPLCGHFFVFWNRRGDQVRILFWDRTGYAIYGKKLARGRFHLVDKLPAGTTHIEVEAAELWMMLEGIELSKAVRRKRWRPAKGRSTKSVSETRGTLIVPPADPMTAAR